MTLEDNKNHWNNIYHYKQSNELSWYEEIPFVSRFLIMKLKLRKDASIIDVGGGDSNLVDFLLKEGYTDVTVLDISEAALNRTKSRLGKQMAEKVNWLVTDISHFKPERQYDFWHDRATFHFLTSETEVQQYISIAHKAVKDQGHISVGTFSTKGPENCSGLSIKQYNEEMLSELFNPFFEKIKCMPHVHCTPTGAEQAFIFCLFTHQIKNQP